MCVFSPSFISSTMAAPKDIPSGQPDPSYWSRALTAVRNCSAQIKTVAPHLATAAKGVAIGCILIGLGSSGLPSVFFGASAIFIVAGNVSELIASLFTLGDYLADLYGKGLELAMGDAVYAARDVFYPLLRTCLDKLADMGTNITADMALKVLWESFLNTHIVKQFLVIVSPA